MTLLPPMSPFYIYFFYIATSHGSSFIYQALHVTFFVNIRCSEFVANCQIFLKGKDAIKLLNGMPKNPSGILGLCYSFIVCFNTTINVPCVEQLLIDRNLIDFILATFNIQILVNLIFQQSLKENSRSTCGPGALVGNYWFIK